MRRCLTLALQLRGLTYRELFAYAVLVSHCRAFVDGDHGICTLLYSTWATEAGVFRPRPGEDADASSRRMESARREMRAIAKLFGVKYFCRSTTTILAGSDGCSLGPRTRVAGRVAPLAFRPFAGRCCGF